MNYIKKNKINISHRVYRLKACFFYQQIHVKQNESAVGAAVVVVAVCNHRILLLVFYFHVG